MAHGSPADERLGDRAHLHRRDDPGVDVDLLERVLQGEGVDDRGQHTHVVGGGPVHPPHAGRQPSEDVPAADHDGDLDAEPMDFSDLFGDLRRHAWVDSERFGAKERLSRHLQENALVRRCSHDRRDYRSAPGCIGGRMPRDFHHGLVE